MSSRVGIWVGETFAETHALNQSGQVVHTDRWFQSKKTLADGLKEAISATAEENGEVFLASSRAESIIERRRGSSPPVLTTAGFESTLQFDVRSPSRPSLRLARTQSIISKERVFGINERIDAEGKIDIPINMEEVELLRAKLELLKSREIAVQLHHSEKNPSHEQNIAAYFREHGFKVFEHHQYPDCIQRAYSEHVVSEEIDGLKAALKESHPGWTIHLWSAGGLLTEWTTSTSAIGGVEACLSKSIASDAPLAFFGLEGFALYQRSTKSKKMPIQPTCQIGNSAMGFPSWTLIDRGFEPGPMLLGKSHQLSLLDILYVRKHLETDIKGFSDRIQEKSHARILEALFTLGKSLADPGRRAVDAIDLANDLELSAAEQINAFVRIHSPAVKPFRIAGPLAASIATLLKLVRPLNSNVQSDVHSIAEAALKGAVS